MDESQSHSHDINYLLGKVGGSGKYQKWLMVIFCMVWLVAGAILMSPPFFFYNFSLQCQKQGLITENCKEYVCSLPEQQRANFYPQTSQIDSIVTEFEHFFCEKEVYVDLASSAVYFGAFIGYILFSFYSDNFGRKLSLALAWGVTFTGSILLFLTENIYMGAAAMFLLGAGGDASLNICFYFLGQVYDNESRQKYSIIIQPFFPAGALLITLAFYLMPNWSLACLIVIAGPSAIVFLGVLFYVKETPMFLMRKGVDQTLKVLNKIGKQNIGLKQILQRQDVENVMNQQVQDKQFHKIITILDLVRFSSLRQISISLWIVNFIVVILYYGPALSIEKIGFDIYYSSLVVQLSQLLVYIPIYHIIDKLERQKAGFFLLTSAGICSFILLFIEKPDDCQFCALSIVQLVIVFFFRFSVSAYYITLYVYMVELYPARSRAMGNGIASAIGTLGSTLSPLLLGVLDRNSIDMNILFCSCAVIGVGMVSFMPETLGLQLKDEIDEIQEQKKLFKKENFHHKSYSNFHSQSEASNIKPRKEYIKSQ